jgi:hypothetical protein
MFWSYDHLQADIYLRELTPLTTDPLFLEYYLTSWITIVIVLTDSRLFVDMVTVALIKLNKIVNNYCNSAALDGDP